MESAIKELYRRERNLLEEAHMKFILQTVAIMNCSGSNEKNILGVAMALVEAVGEVWKQLHEQYDKDIAKSVSANLKAIANRYSCRFRNSAVISIIEQLSAASEALEGDEHSELANCLAKLLCLTATLYRQATECGPKRSREEADLVYENSRMVHIRFIPLSANIHDIANAVRGGNISKIRFSTFESTCDVTFQTSSGCQAFLEYTAEQGGTCICDSWCPVELAPRKLSNRPTYSEFSNVEHQKSRVLVLKNVPDHINAVQCLEDLDKLPRKDIPREEMIIKDKDRETITISCGSIQAAECYKHHLSNYIEAYKLCIMEYGKDPCSGPINELPLRHPVAGRR